MNDRAINLDNCQRKRVPRFYPLQRRSPPLFEQSSIPSVRARLSSEEPMKLGGTRLSSADRHHRFASDSCLYCE